MRVCLACACFACMAGCMLSPFSPGSAAVGNDSIRVLDLAGGVGHCTWASSRVLHSTAELEAFLARDEDAHGARAADGFAQRLRQSQPDFGKQALVLVRHYSSSDSTFRLRAHVDRARKLICKIRKLHSGQNRDHEPHWFAVVVDREAIAWVEVHVDGSLEQEFPSSRAESKLAE